MMPNFPIDKKIRYVTLAVTESCNLRCSYCYEEFKSAKNMDRNTAKRIIDKEFGDLGEDEAICLDFFGGEPFVNFVLIEFVTDYIETNYSACSYILFVTTNGTLIHGEIKKWLLRHENFVCGLSLDGTKKMHDINRDNSYDRIDVDFFATQYPHQEIKMTVSEKTLPSFSEGVIFCHNKGFMVSANLAFGINWNDEKNIELLDRELHILIDYYLKNPNIKPCSMLDFDIIPAVLTPHEGYTRKWCGTGTSMHTYDVNGKLYPCQFFMPVSLGKEKSIESSDFNIPTEIPLSLFDSKCQNCEVINICPMCYGSNYAATGSFYSVDANMCKMTKIIMKARSYFRARQLELKQIKLSPCEEADLIEAILKIQGMVV